MKQLLCFTFCLFAFVAILPAASFTNGNFETGNATGWTTGTGYRASYSNPAITPADFLPGGKLYNGNLNHSGIVTPGLDPNTGNQLNRVYSGNYSWRVEDTTYGGYGSSISQTVPNYTDPQIFFAWAAVLEEAHSASNAATVQIYLRDLTVGDLLISREYNAASGSGGGSRFNYNAATGFYWTPWQIEQLSIPQNRMGNTMQLSILAADCQPTGHAGYLFLDGFGAVAPPPIDDTTVPEPGTYLLAAAGLTFLGLARKLRT